MIDSLVINIKRLKVVIFVKASLDSFLGEVCSVLSKKYEVKEIIINDLSGIYSEKGCPIIDDAMEWADICWFEWCDELIEYGSKHKMALSKKIILRIHSYEVFTEYINRVNWATVDRVIFVANHIRDYALENCKLERDKTIIIPNGINTEKYKYREGKKGFNICFVGYINYKKGPMLFLQTCKAIYDYDNRYKIYIAGEFQDPRDILYFRQMLKLLNLQNNIIYEGWRNDLDTWMEDKDYILCTSVLESQNISVMQAMSKGIKPIIHNFVGALDIYPKELVFNTISEALDILKEDDYSSKSYREYIENNYSVDVVNTLLLEEMKNLEEYDKEPLVSVVMAVYNREKYVKNAIESVLNQSYKKLELIIINDGSTDNSENIIKSFNDNRIKYYSNENKGQLSTLKFGYERANGEFITRVDSDDFIEKDYIKTCAEKLSSDTKYKFVYTDFYMTDSNGEVISYTKFNDYDTSIQLLMDVFSTGTSFIPDVAFFRKDYLHNVILNYTEQNIPFYIDNLLNSPFYHIKKPLYYYRQHEENYAKDNSNVKLIVDGNVKFIELLFRRYFVQMNLNNDFLENKNTYINLIYKYLTNLSKYYRDTLNLEVNKNLTEIPEAITEIAEKWLDKTKVNTDKKLNYLVENDLNKRILIVSTDDPLEGRAVGGKHTHINLLQKGLREENIYNKLIVPKVDREISVNPKTVFKYMLDEVDYKAEYKLVEKLIDNSKDSSFFYFVYAIQRRLEEKIEKALIENYYSVISCQDVIATMAAYKVREKLKFIIPIVTTLHGYFTNENVDYGAVINNGPVYDYFIEYEKKACDVSDKIITVDTRIKNYVNDFNLKDKPVIKVLKNAADNITFSSNSKKYDRNLNIILVPRRLVPKNGVVYAVKAVEKLLEEGIYNFSLIIAGDGIERKNIEEYINENNKEYGEAKIKLSTVVKLLGNVSHNEIQDIYKAAHYILIPSIKSNNIEEATSVALLEGMACEKVVIASAVGGMLEIIEDGVNGYLVDSSNVNALATKLKEVISLTDEDYDLISKKAKADIEKYYSYKVHTEKFIDIIFKNLVD